MVMSHTLDIYSNMYILTSLVQRHAEGGVSTPLAKLRGWIQQVGGFTPPNKKAWTSLGYTPLHPPGQKSTPSNTCSQGDVKLKKANFA